MTVETAAAPLVRARGCCVPLAEPLPSGVAEELAEAFRAAADPTRAQMLHMLKAAREAVCVCDFTAAFDLSQPTISHHLTRLREAGFVTSAKKGVWSYHRLREDMPASARAVLGLIP